MTNSQTFTDADAVRLLAALNAYADDCGDDFDPSISATLLVEDLITSISAVDESAASARIIDRALRLWDRTPMSYDEAERS